MRGKFLSLAQFLGALSFPLYLIHIPILFSLVCWVYLKSVSIGIFALVWMIPFALIVSTIAALPLILINQHWLRFLNAKL
jgi:peptidoglycan/LPS O-acetylase OafA/YrhL